MARTYAHRLEKTALVVGFCSLALAVLAAHGAPAQGYELSVYRATPTLFWAGVAVAFITGIVVAVSSPDWYRSLGLVLGGTTTLAIASLPLLRSYHFYGPGDSLTHLGWTKDIASGDMAVYELLYPGTHTIGVVISEVTGLSLRRSLMVMVAAFVLVYLLFVPLAVSLVVDDDRAVTFAAIAAYLLLPINAISVFVMPHPTSQAILFLPLLVYLVAKYVTGTDGRRVPLFGTASGSLLALASMAMVLVHPQQAANAILLFGGFVLVQIVYRLFREGHAIARHRAMYAHTMFLMAMFLLWTPLHERSGGAARALVTSLIDNPAAAADTANAAASLSQLGGSIRILFLKLFFVSLIFSVFAGLFMLGGLFDRIRATETSAFAKYLTVGMVPLFGLFCAFLVASLGQFHFRVLGFMMVPVTMLGGIAIARAMGAVEQRLPNADPVPGFAAGLFLFLLVLSIPTIFHSPYMYQPSGQVSESQMAGYELAFDERGEARFTGLRASGERYTDAILGFEASKRADFRGEPIYGSDINATEENFTARRLVSAFDGPRYLPITDSAKKRELTVYNGFRFPKRGFRTLESNPEVARVQSGGDFQLYYLNATG
ncbi:hypothetical protein [Haladaptatus sp. NG-SE-30]